MDKDRRRTCLANKSGVLSKRADKRWWKWSERRFELCGSRLLYFRAGHLNGEFDLSSSCAVRRDEKDPLKFTLRCVGMKWFKEENRKARGNMQTLHLKASTSEEAYDWIEAFRRSIAAGDDEGNEGFASKLAEDRNNTNDTEEHESKYGSSNDHIRTKNVLHRYNPALDTLFCAKEILFEGPVRTDPASISIRKADEQKLVWMRVYNRSCTPQLVCYQSQPASRNLGSEDDGIAHFTVPSLREYEIDSLGSENRDGDASNSRVERRLSDADVSKDDDKAWTCIVSLRDNAADRTLKFAVKSALIRSEWLEALISAGASSIREKESSLVDGNAPISASSENDSVVKEGWVEKRGQHNTSYRRRWLLLRKSTPQLEWRADPLSGTAKNSIDRLSVRHRMTRIDDVSIHIWHKTKRQLMFRVASKLEADEWIDALKRVASLESATTRRMPKRRRSLRRLRQRISSSDCASPRDVTSDASYGAWMDIARLSVNEVRSLRWKRRWLLLHAPHFVAREQAQAALCAYEAKPAGGESDETKAAVPTPDLRATLDMSCEVAIQHADVEEDAGSFLSVSLSDGSTLSIRAENAALLREWHARLQSTIEKIHEEVERRVRDACVVAHKFATWRDVRETDRGGGDGGFDFGRFERVVLCQRSLFKRGSYLSTRRDVVLTCSHLSWTTSSSDEYRKLRLCDIASIDDGSSSQELSVVLKRGVALVGQKRGSDALHFRAPTESECSFWKFLLRRILKIYERSARDSVFLEGWISSLESERREPIWRARYAVIRVCARSDAKTENETVTTLSLFADVNSAATPLRRFTISGHTCCARMLCRDGSNDDSDVRFAFRLSESARALDRRADAYTSEEEEEENTISSEESSGSRSIALRASSSDECDRWIASIQALIVKMDVPHWMRSWHLWSRETRENVAIRMFEDTCNEVRAGNVEASDWERFSTTVLCVSQRIRKLCSECVTERRVSRRDVLRSTVATFLDRVVRRSMPERGDRWILRASDASSSSPSSSSNVTGVRSDDIDDCVVGSAYRSPAKVRRSVRTAVPMKRRPSPASSALAEATKMLTSSPAIGIEDFVSELTDRLGGSRSPRAKLLRTYVDGDDDDIDEDDDARTRLRQLVRFVRYTENLSREALRSLHVALRDLLRAGETACDLFSATKMETCVEVTDDDEIRRVRCCLADVERSAERYLQLYALKERSALDRGVLSIVRTFLHGENVRSPKMRSLSSGGIDDRVVTGTRWGESVLNLCKVAFGSVKNRHATELRSVILHELIRASERHVLLVAKRMRPLILNGAFDMSMAIAATNDFGELQKWFGDRVQEIADALLDDDRASVDDDIDNVEEALWRRLAEFGKRAGSASESVFRWATRRVWSSGRIYPKLSFGDRPLHDHPGHVQRALAAANEYIAEDIAKRLRWDSAKHFMLACVDTFSVFVLSRVFDAVLRPSSTVAKTKDAAIIDTIGSLFSSFRGGGGDDASKKGGGRFTQVELRGRTDYAVGQSVVVRLERRKSWIRGRIIACDFSRNAYDVQFVSSSNDDGTVERGVGVGRLRTTSQNRGAVPRAVRSALYGVALVPIPFEIAIRIATGSAAAKVQPKEVVRVIGDMLEPFAARRLKKDEDVGRALENYLFDSFGTADGGVDVGQLLQSVQCEVVNDSDGRRSIASDIGCVRAWLSALPFRLAEREMRSNPDVAFRRAKGFRDHFVHRRIEERFGVISAFLTSPLTSLRTEFEMLVNLGESAGDVADMLRVCLRCRGDVGEVERNGFAETIDAWERYFGTTGGIREGGDDDESSVRQLLAKYRRWAKKKKKTRTGEGGEVRGNTRKGEDSATKAPVKPRRVVSYNVKRSGGGRGDATTPPKPMRRSMGL